MQNSRSLPFCIVLALAEIFASKAHAQGNLPDVDFNRDIRPILSDKCFRCHGPDSANREANLRLDREEEAKADHLGRRIISPGELGESELVRRITSHDPGELMPPMESGKQLSPQEIATLKKWVADGAVWSLPWTFVKPRHHDVPQVIRKDWPLNWIDHFILARLENKQFLPSPQADKTTLIRRLSIDLTGLPPKAAEVEAFKKDASPDAYERLVDRLLASPRFGERMAIYWLDLVRYADTVGYHGDQEHHISPYRDYVIKAFNSDLPFDRFTREQLAGDLLPEPTIEQQIATGYNRVLQTSHEGGVQVNEYVAIYGADRVRNVSGVWMGATMGCCQCHDHKFDPYTMRDFYSMKAFFADIDDTDHLLNGLDKSPTVRKPEIEILGQDQFMQVGGSLSESRQTMITVALAEPRVTRILPRGNWLDESGDVVEPAIPQFLGNLEIGQRRATRLDLANWLTDAQHGSGALTARVMANRFWYLMFGRGLTASLDDFGGQGEAPSHPELLDNLTIEFVESGWNVKHLLKLLAMSRAYQQSSRETKQMHDHDPMNALVAHQGRFRFPAEVVRDSTLMVSGLLVEKPGGPSAKPYQPAGYYRNLNMPEREYEADVNESQWRRGVYVHWQRQYLHPMLKAFDAPSREECTAQRQRSNTPLAALVLLNDPTFVEAARSFAGRILTEANKSTEARLEFAFRQAVSRAPTDQECVALTKLLDKSSQEFADNTDAVEPLLSIGLKPVPENLDRKELAIWTVVARAILSLNEALMRN